MSVIVKIFLVCALISSSHQDGELDAKLNPLRAVICYDASQCCSINWFTKDFPNILQMFGNYINLKFAPCQLIQLSSDGKTMTCDAPDKNCELNKLHACAVYHIDDADKLKNFIACTFAKGAASSKECLSDQQLENAVETCFKGDEGFKACVEFSQIFEQPLPRECLPFFFIPKNFYYYPPYLTTDALCRQFVMGNRSLPPSCPSDV